MRDDQILTEHDGFAFRFTVESHGWALIELRPSGLPGYCWHVSYLSDALGDFLRAAGNVCSGYRASASVIWQLEPAVVRCQLQRATEDAITCTLSVAASESAPFRMLGSFEVPTEKFVTGILAGAAAIDRSAYSARWPDYSFPDEELAVLANSRYK